MNRRLKIWVLAVGGSLVAATPHLAHGGNFPPPANDPPGPGWAGPGDTTPSGSGGGGPGGAPVPSPAAPTPLAPPSTGTPSAPNGGAAPNPATAPMTAGGGLSLADLDLTLWNWWWEFNKEPFLELKGHLYSDPATTGGDGFFLGRGERTRSTSGRRPTPERIRKELIPALIETLRAEGANDVTTGCLIALARIGEDYPGADRIELQNILRPYIASSNQEVAETATIALGILGHESAALVLSELLLDTSLGAREVGRSSVPLRTRSFAGYALGLIGAQTENEDVRRYVASKLTRALEEDDSATPDVGVACVLSLGRLPLAWSGATPDRAARKSLIATASREAQILYLLDVLGDEKRHRIVRAHTPTSLAFLLTADTDERYRGDLRDLVGKELLRRFEPRKREPREVRQSIAIAFGLLGDNDDDSLDRDIRGALLDPGGDRQVQHFALIALGRTTARPGNGTPDDVDQVRSELLSELNKGSDNLRWSALALALFERGRRAAGYDTTPEVLSALRGELADASSPLDVGALSIACGILGEPGAAEELLGQLRQISDDQARGYTAVGLGLVDARQTTDEIRAIASGATYRPTLLREAAIALGLLGDKDVTDLLTGKLVEANSLAAQASIAQALGRIGDAGSIAPLVELLQDEDKTASARAFAAVALGIVADQDELPWNTILAVDLNYTAAPATLYDQAGFGILNIL